MSVPGSQLKVDCRVVLVVHCKTLSLMMNPLSGAGSASGSDSSHLLPGASAQIMVSAEYLKWQWGQVMKTTAEQVLQAAEIDVDL
jgi:hypothetical protein